jgi:sugar (pentulose or hexulose) kinase
MLAECMAVMDREVAPPTSTVLTGGWSTMASVVRSRSVLLPDVTVSTHDEGTAYGAALFAAFAVSSDSFEVVAESFLSSSLVAGGGSLVTNERS